MNQPAASPQENLSVPHSSFQGGYQAEAGSAQAGRSQAESSSANGNGAWIWVVNGVGTLLFAAFILTAAAAGGTLDFSSMIVSLVFFALGCVAFCWAFAVMAKRSRTEKVSVAGAFMLAEGAGRGHRFIFLSELGVQTAAALIAASVRLYTPAAFGILVPVFGLGMMSLWGAKHARFPPKPLYAGVRGNG